MSNLWESAVLNTMPVRNTHGINTVELTEQQSPVSEVHDEGSPQPVGEARQRPAGASRPHPVQWQEVDAAGATGVTLHH